MSLSIKKTLFAVGALALIVNAPTVLGAAAVSMTMLYAASYVTCSNTTHCNMNGDMASKMYNVGSSLHNDTRILPFLSASANSIRLGQVGVQYMTDGNWPSGAEFLSNGDVKLYPVISNDTKWQGIGDNAMCEGSAGDCPFTDEAPILRM